MIERIQKPDDSQLAELEQGLLIDENALDEAIERQPDYFHRVSKRLALLISRRDAAKQFLEDEEARIDTNLRHLAKKNDDKLTESEIKAQIRLQPEIKLARKEHHRLSESVGIYTALEKSFQQRSYALGHLVDLYISGYFGNLTHSGNSRGMKEHSGEQARRAMNELRKGARE
jgi:hypothetical protein